MPRSNGIYSPPSGTNGVPLTPISSAAYNGFVADIVADQNNPRPVIAGGTGASTAGGARTNLGLGDAATKNVGTTAGTVAAGDDSRITGALQKVGGIMSGPLVLPAGTTTAAPLNMPHGVAPTAPVNGDVWTTTSDILARIDGTSRTFYHDGNLATVEQSEAEAGTATTARLWTSERVRQNAKAYTDSVALGVGQTRTDVSGSRSTNTVYQNATGRPIYVNVQFTTGAGRSLQISANGSSGWRSVATGSTQATVSASTVILAGEYYRVQGGFDIWEEVR